MPSALFILPESPFPPRCGNAWRDAQQIALLQRLGWDVHLAILKPRRDLSSGEEASALNAIPAVYARRSQPIEESTAANLIRKTTYLFGSKRHAYAWWADRLSPAEFLPAAFDSSRPTAVIIRSTFLHWLPAIRSQFDGTIVVDCHDADVHLAEETIRSVSGIRKLGPWLNLLAVRRCCRSYLPLADELWAVSSEDAARIQCSGQPQRMIVVPSGMPEPETSVAWPGINRSALVVANYGYQPNQNGVEWLLSEVWPHVLRAIPDARLDLIGGNMPPSLRTLVNSARGVRVHGLVPHIDESYDQAGLILVPILEGSGTRLKIVDAWRRGKAVLTTTKGAEGLSGATFASAVVDEPIAFANEAAKLMVDSDARRALGEKGLMKSMHELSYSAIESTLKTQSILRLETSQPAASFQPASAEACPTR